MKSPDIKEYLARMCDWTGASLLVQTAQSLFVGPHVRAINYHDVPWSLAAEFEEQIAYFADHYEPVDLAGLRSTLRGDRVASRPGLIITFDDGLRSHADVAAPILERYGFCGWFMVPTDFVSTPPKEQAGWAIERQIRFTTEGFEDGRIALSLDDLMRLDRRHVIGCHTRTHRRLSNDLDEAALVAEILGSKDTLQSWLAHEVPVFSWVGGEEHSYSEAAAWTIARAGFEVSFMTNSAPIHSATHPLQLQRSNIEAEFSMELTRFTLSGLYDLLYWPKRRRVNTLTNVGPVRSSSGG